LQQFKKEIKVELCQSKLLSRLALGFQHGSAAEKTPNLEWH